MSPNTECASNSSPLSVKVLLGLTHYQEQEFCRLELIACNQQTRDPVVVSMASIRGYNKQTKQGPESVSGAPTMAQVFSLEHNIKELQSVAWIWTASGKTLGQVNSHIGSPISMGIAILLPWTPNPCISNPPAQVARLNKKSYTSIPKSRTLVQCYALPILRDEMRLREVLETRSHCQKAKEMISPGKTKESLELKFRTS